MTVISVDLAYRDYRDFGMVVLDEGALGAKYEVVPLESDNLKVPTPEHVADFIIGVCMRTNASLILLDGPQGWKDPSNGLTYSRCCERDLNTPGKTGLPGNVKPANYLPFFEFSIRVFDAFHERGWPRYDPVASRSVDSVVIESFPLAAWRSLGLPSLPAKKKARDTDIEKYLRSLTDAGLVAGGGPMLTHDQLQALVAGLGGLGVSACAPGRFKNVGVSPFLLDGKWREGYIVNPTRE